MNDLHEQFIAEARDLISQATDDLVALERHGAAPAPVERVLRAFHTLKGAAGLVELPAMSLALHAAEDVLAAIRAGRVSATREIVDQALACLDLTAGWVDEFERRRTLSPGSGENARDMADRLRSLLPDAMAPVHAGFAGSPTARGAPQDWIDRLVGSCHAPLAHQPSGGGRLSAICYEPLVDCFFTGDDPLGLMRKIPELLAFRIEPREPWPPLSQLDPHVCNLRLLALAGADPQELARIFRLVPDQVEIVELPWSKLLPTPIQPVADGTTTRGLIRAIIDEQRAVLRYPRQADTFIGCAGAAARTSANALRRAGAVDLAARVEHAGADALSQFDANPLLSVLEEAMEALGEGSGAVPALPPASVMTRREAAQEAAKVGTQAPAARLLRVNEAKVDALVGLAGELIVAKNGLGHLVRRLEHELAEHPLATAARRDHAAITRLVGEIHAAILELRTVTVAQAFRPLSRLVRDLSHQLGKHVSFVADGETTEADKMVVERLSEPLIHLLRNAIDHGIETPEQRRLAGKVDPATIWLRASRMGDRLVVEVGDDGRGIDPAVVRSRARNRKLIADDDLAALSDEQVVDLIFAAGFSTASQISEISGRGIGLDVVRTTIEHIGGSVSVRSGIGIGTTVRLELPVTIAISRIMVVESAGELFGIPLEAVIETVRLPADRISLIRGNEGFVLRERIVPICALASLMQLSPVGNCRPEARLLVVVETGGKIAALEVDAIRDQLDAVLKPMDGLLANARGYGGTTVLEDGRVLLILDLKELVA